ncbi:uncharacterized protein BCR38DRAFT_426767 [Pseudomassariella vexata]|uniref:holo-[acyl-carrier-protein] synthase n=1 Tax=Pseudomassariella vexata TaxID=1141098 RepID=A0A1Y2E902_9PEZI|nr:uncharacterized protein BCR38DRAFT_426767 [Pseudomassariella vexata]ORY67345.1 hypothetical protein BCR38DRAFT_426767 [Pseudomassariella vexata]
MASSGLTIIQWLVDTRGLWLEATKTTQLQDAAPRALALLTPEEKAGVLKYYFVRDAKMALASHLLKHFVISKYAGVPWSETTLTRDANKKPIYVDPASGKQPIQFNVSHQAGIVALVAVAGYDVGQVDAGVDVVCVSERRDRDHKVVKEEGWSCFVDMHSDVFGRSEAGYLKNDLLTSHPGVPPLRTEEDIVGFKLRSFYTLWCLREAYVKMTGEALLAEWLKDLEFKRFKAPKPAAVFKQGGGDEGETITTHEVLFKGAKVDDANICLRSLGQDYMTCTAVRTPNKKEDGLSWELGPFEFLDIGTILDHAEASDGHELQ